MKTTMLTMLLASSSFAFAFDAPADPAIQALPAQPVPVSELQLMHLPAGAGDLPSISTEDLRSGAVFNVYYDATSAELAERSIPILAAFYREIAAMTAADPAEVDWDGVVFARNAEDLVLRMGKDETRWKVDVGADGEPTEAGAVAFYALVPHEQVHSTQNITQRPPHWFLEGQATWGGAKITDKWNPEIARERRREMAAEVAAADEPLHLAAWGSVQPKFEAMLRQLTPEQRAEVENDPSKMPPGPFIFGPEDLMTDVSNFKTRYGASLALFERIEQEAGHEAMLSWFKAVQQRTDRIDSDAMAELVRLHTGVDITDALQQ